MWKIFRCRRGEIKGLSPKEKACFYVSKESITGIVNDINNLIVNDINNLKNPNIKLSENIVSENRGRYKEYTVAVKYLGIFYKTILKMYEDHPRFNNMIETSALNPEGNVKQIYNILEKYIA